MNHALRAPVLFAVGLLALATSCSNSQPEPQLPARTISQPPAPEQEPENSFVERAEQAGLDFRMHFLPTEQGETFRVNLYDHGCGVVVGDYDADGYDDIYFLNQLGGNALYKNRGNGTFQDVTARSPVLALEDRICVGGTFADYDNDGDRDLFVTSTRGGNVLFRNDGDTQFQDVTDQAGLTLIAHSQTPAFLDYDNDGLLDLLVTNTAEWTLADRNEELQYHPGRNSLFELAGSAKEYNVLYRNRGDGTFEDVTETAGLSGIGWGGDIAAFDYDEDGHLDVLITNMFGRSALYHNQGDGTFEDRTEATLRKTSWGAIGAKPLDYTGDGKLDLLIVDMHSDMWMVEDFDPLRIEEHRKYPHVLGPNAVGSPQAEESEAQVADSFGIDYQRVLFGNSLFENQGNGTFTETSDQAGMETFWPWGIAAGDFDNDGDLDVFLPSGMGYPYFYWRNYLMLNDGGGHFEDASRETGIEPTPRGKYLKERIAGREATRSSRCAASADFDGDGRLDLIVNNFNDQPFYFRNHLADGHWLALRLTGTASNRDAVGALVRLYLGNRVLVRQVHAAGGYLSQSSQTLHFGLGEADHVDRIEIRWPRGKMQVLEQPEVDRLHEITEPDPA